MKKKLSSEKLHIHLPNRVESVIRDNKLLQEDDKVIVAVSGGSDSLALLYLLHDSNLRLDLFAVYVDHGLRIDETPIERKLIKQYCHSLQIPFTVRAVDVHKLMQKKKHSPEDAARILRYDALEQIRSKNEAKVIAVGHTADDQVEEFFLRLLRGSSLKGLSGMKLQRDKIIRPLLFERKKNLCSYLQDLNVSWCIDSSNSDKRFLRNRVRLDLLPKLEKEFNPSIRKIVLQSMDIFSEEDKFLDEITDKEFEKSVELGTLTTSTISTPLVIINILEFLKNHPAIRRRILEKCCWQMNTRPTFDQIEILLQMIEKGGNGSELHLKNLVRAEKRDKKLYLFKLFDKEQLRGSVPTTPSVAITISGPGVYPIHEIGKEIIVTTTNTERYPENDTPSESQLSVDLGKLSFPLLLRSSLPGERFYPCNGSGSKKISRYFNDRKIPKKERPGWPILLSGNNIVAIPGLQIDHNFRITDDTTDILTIWLKDSDR